MSNYTSENLINVPAANIPAGTFSVQNYYQGLPQLGLVFYASLNGSNPNQAETGQLLSTTGTTSYSSDQGLPNPCVYINNARISCSASDIPLDSAFTLSFWFKTTGVSGWRNYIGTCNTGEINILARDNIFGFYFGSNISLGCTISADTWYNYIVTFENNTITIYLNGAIVQSFQHSFSSLLSGNFIIGNCYNDGCTAYMAAVRIYNRMLDSTEITALASEFTPTVS